MAILQIIDNTGSEAHNYKNKTIIGHGYGSADRTADSDTDEWYTRSVFDEGK